MPSPIATRRISGCSLDITCPLEFGVLIHYAPEAMSREVNSDQRRYRGGLARGIGQPEPSYVVGRPLRADYVQRRLAGSSHRAPRSPGTEGQLHVMESICIREGGETLMGLLATWG